uniref:Uncharacterized protein n=1 Tax=Anopheles quadriannulatus TaxID=34691 RepID=A0A182XSA9_ANOQN
MVSFLANNTYKRRNVRYHRRVH